MKGDRFILGKGIWEYHFINSQPRSDFITLQTLKYHHEDSIWKKAKKDKIRKTYAREIYRDLLAKGFFRE